MSSGEPLVVCDARLDKRFADDPLVLGEPHLRFYAGIPLRSVDGFILGTLSVVADEPRELSRREQHGLDLLAKLVLTLHAKPTDVSPSRAEAAGYEAQVAEAREAELNASRVKSQFLTNMSHELRTPMNGVLGMLALVLDTTLTPEQREYAEVARESAQMMLEMVNDVLDIAKIEAGHLVLQRVPFGLRQVVARAIRAMAIMASRKGVETEVLVADDIADVVTGDLVHFRQILLHIYGNAVKFTSEGRIFVRVFTKAQEPHRIYVRVEDTGIGIAPEKQAAIFQPFQRADDSSTRIHHGAGLGLAICAALTRLMGGGITLDSALGRGSTFCFHVILPAVEGAEVASVTIEEPAAGPSSGRHLRVLLAEDNRVATVVATRILQKQNCEVVHAVDGTAAVSAASAQPFDLILMDVQMPNMDGLEATRQIRMRERGARVRIVALTASAMADDRAQCIAAGMDGFLAKPFQMPDLIKLLDMHRTGAGLAQMRL